jgi:hypothetical protein
MTHKEAAITQRAGRARLWIWGVYIVLFAISIPWYLPADATPELWLGLPYWVVVSLGACLAIACFTALAVRLVWSDDESGDGH